MPQKYVVYESFVFNSRVQKDNESALSFAQALHQPSVTCDFSSLRDRLITERLIIGIKDKILRERMLDIL